MIFWKYISPHLHFLLLQNRVAAAIRADSSAVVNSKGEAWPAGRGAEPRSELGPLEVESHTKEGENGKSSQPLSRAKGINSETTKH